MQKHHERMRPLVRWHDEADVEESAIHCAREKAGADEAGC
jgi:hypothetical protein